MTQGSEVIVRDIMMRGPVTLGCDDLLDLADDVMNLGRIRHIPIMGFDSRGAELFASLRKCAIALLYL